MDSLSRNSGNKHQNNTLVSAETVRHSSTYIILCRFSASFINMKQGGASLSIYRRLFANMNIISTRMSLNKGALLCWYSLSTLHDDVIKWKLFPRYLPLVRKIHLSQVNSAQSIEALIYCWTNDWANNRDAGDLRCPHAHYAISMMYQSWIKSLRIATGIEQEHPLLYVKCNYQTI